VDAEEPVVIGPVRARITVRQIKVAHTAVFWMLSFCVLYVLFSGVTARVTRWTWLAVGLVCVEGIVLAAFGGTCPLTILAERSGAARGSVADLFLPKWFADRIFPICGTTFLAACLVLGARLLAAAIG
jgi:hypothetical protein